MNTRISRRRFAATGAAASLASLLPRGVFSQGTANKNAIVHAGDSIGVVKPEFHSNFAEHLGSCVYGGIWVGPNSPIPNIEGFRKDTVDALKDLGVPVLRWPGGCFADDYHWRDGIGPAARRPKRVNTTWGGYTEDNSFGTHEFIRFCRLIGSEPYFAANVGTGTPQDVRDWIEYCNYPAGSTLADERAANGSKEPFNVRYWGVGNELWGCGGNFTPQAAASEFVHFATFARQFGPTRLFLVGCGPSGDDTNWTRGFMDTLGGHIGMMSGYSMHYYTGGDLRPLQFDKDAMYRQFNLYPLVERSLIHQRTLLDGYDPNRRIGLFLDEWGVWDQMSQPEEAANGRLWQQATIRSAVAAALGLNIFNRQADKLFMCNIAQLINVLQSLLLTDGPTGQHCVKTANYHAFMLFKPHRGNTSVRVEADGMRLPDGRGGGRGRGAEQPPEISVSASRGDGRMVVSLVNPRADADWTVDVALRGVTAHEGSARILHDSDINAANSFENPGRLAVKPHEVAVEGGHFRIALPAMSVATVTLKVTESPA